RDPLVTGVQTCALPIFADGNDLDAIDEAITQAKRVRDRPSLIIVRTHIAWGSPHKQDTAEAHGAPLGVDEVKATKQNLGWPSLEIGRASWRGGGERAVW